MKELTKRQRAILEFVTERILHDGAPPTIREIGERFDISSTNGVRQHIDALIRKGFLVKDQYLARGLRLARSLGEGFKRLPLVGSVPAGMPIDAIENIETEIAVDQTFLPKGESFTLRVTGDSMKNAGILDGDLVVVRKQQVARRGDIVVAIIGDEATVKRYVPDGNQIRLEPENDDYEPIIVNKRSSEFRISGKVVGLLRKF